MFLSQRNFAGVVGWTLCVTAFFVEFGSLTLVGWTIFMVVGAVPPLMFVLLAGRSADHDRRGVLQPGEGQGRQRL